MVMKMQIHTHSVIIISHETKFTLVASHLRVLFHVSFAFLHSSETEGVTNSNISITLEPPCHM